MDRRQFMKLAAGAPLMLEQKVAETSATNVHLRGGNSRRFPRLTVKGSYREIGYAIGSHCGGSIRKVMKRRSEWHDGLLAVLRSERGQRRSRELLDLSRKHFPHLVDELHGMAEGAALPFDAIWVMTIKSELGAMEPEIPGCSTVYVGGENKKWLWHNEDGNAAYADLMFLVRVRPPSGVDFISLVYPGILTGNGPSMNNRGVIQTTNYIGSTRSAVGLPRYIIGRAILEAESLEAARKIATMEPRAFPYHHNLAGIGERRYLSVETVPGAAAVATPKGLFVHTNHLLHKATRGYDYEEAEYRSKSSMSRFSVLKALSKKAAVQNLSPDTILQWLSSHSGKPYSPCRHPEEEVQGQTLTTAFFDITKGTMRVYKGNPCMAKVMGAWTEVHV